MEIEFVNHSSFIIHYKEKRIICDPWIEGSVFNNGWSLISKSKFTYEDFARINYIWFSHEHPDHFYPPNIVKIPDEFKKNITILFQYTKDKRVVDYCKKLNFKEVIELKPNTWVNLYADLKILCEHFQEGDSWICFQTPEYTYLNTNDCGITKKTEAKKILSKIGKVDILFSQFSYAYWVGNPDQKIYREQKALEKLNLLRLQCEVFKPKITIPIASFVYFSHVENYWLNDSINTPRIVFEFLKKNTTTQPVILYPGEKYVFNQFHDTENSIRLYENDYETIKNINFYSKTIIINKYELESTAKKFIQDLNETNSWWIKKFLKPTYIFLRDYNTAYILSLNEFKEIDKDEDYCDVSLTSENLLFCFKYPYGLDTTQINGRMLKPKYGNYKNFYNLFRINQLKSRGINPNSISYILTFIKRKLFANY